MSDSTEIDDGGNAFPAMLPGGNYCTPGMTLRDWFAGQAMAQLIYRRENTETETYSRPEIGYESYHYADAMIAARNAKQ